MMAGSVAEGNSDGADDCDFDVVTAANISGKGAAASSDSFDRGGIPLREMLLRVKQQGGSNSTRLPKAHDAWHEARNIWHWHAQAQIIVICQMAHWIVQPPAILLHFFFKRDWGMAFGPFFAFAIYEDSSRSLDLFLAASAGGVLCGVMKHVFRSPRPFWIVPEVCLKQGARRNNRNTGSFTASSVDSDQQNRNSVQRNQSITQSIRVQRSHVWLSDPVLDAAQDTEDAFGSLYQDQNAASTVLEAVEEASGAFYFKPLDEIDSEEIQKQKNALETGFFFRHDKAFNPDSKVRFWYNAVNVLGCYCGVALYACAVSQDDVEFHPRLRIIAACYATGISFSVIVYTRTMLRAMLTRNQFKMARTLVYFFIGLFTYGLFPLSYLSLMNSYS